MADKKPWWAGPNTPEWMLTAGPLAAGFVPGVGEAMDASDAYDAFTEGNYGEGLGIAATGLFGLVPGVGDATASAARTARRLSKADKLGAMAMNPKKVKSINPNWNPNNPDHRLAAQMIGDDAVRVVQGVPEVGTKSRRVKDFEVGGVGLEGRKMSPNDLVEYQLPSKQAWDEAGLSSVPMPDAPPIIQVAKNPKSTLPMSAIPHSPMPGRPGKAQFKSKAGPLAGKSAGQALDEVATAPLDPIGALMQKHGWNREKAEKMFKILGG